MTMKQDYAEMSTTVSSLFLYSMVAIFCMFFSHPAIMLSCLCYVVSVPSQRPDTCSFLLYDKFSTYISISTDSYNIIKKEKVLQQTLIGSSCLIQTQSVSELKDFVKKLNSLPEMTVSIFYFFFVFFLEDFIEGLYMIIKLSSATIYF